MIFVTLGSQKFQMNRVLKALDNLVGLGSIESDVIAQTGYSTYIPRNFKSQPFFKRSDFLKTMDSSSIIITHGGTGAIVSALKRDKKVIAIPRDLKFKEHVDNHQFEIVDVFASENMLKKVIDLSELKNAIHNINNTTFSKFKSTQNVMLNELYSVIEKNN